MFLFPIIFEPLQEYIQLHVYQDMLKHYHSRRKPIQ